MRSGFQGAWIDRSDSRGSTGVANTATSTCMKLTATYPDWWPAGCDESLVRSCNCDHCGEMIDALEDYRQGQAPDGENKTLEAYR